MPNISQTTKDKRLAINRPRSIAYIRRFLKENELGGHRLDLARNLFPYMNTIFFNDALTGITFNSLRLSDRWGDYEDNTRILRLHLSINNRARLVGTLLHELCHAAVHQINKTVEKDQHGPIFLSWLTKVQEVFTELTDDLVCRPP
uniref:SprT-like domain-containing protein n=1 Tax=Meloidogyne javanica TaxID=6303 RepID=A0A915MWI4_MELJA